MRFLIQIGIPLIAILVALSAVSPDVALRNLSDWAEVFGIVALANAQPSPFALRFAGVILALAGGIIGYAQAARMLDGRRWAKRHEEHVAELEAARGRLAKAQSEVADSAKENLRLAEELAATIKTAKAEKK
ncbi:hypothetical protein [Jiella sonneratiae]|uniref:DUF1049 domain-containing protein n=1 Tax=Jiella sonneratiae TaxID=2816856 RepID=A0ABS3J314_9HYPH|nr:hypothetical protein [Jiella sonneratiae]MBO0904050.1 hypothetical protein [Jiella sonneratiae]